MFLLKNKWILFIGALLIVVLSFMGLLYQGRPMRGPSSNNTVQQNSALSPFLFLQRPTPTPFQLPKLTVVDITPADEETDVDTLHPIIITFSRPITVEEQLSIRLRLNPTASGSASWTSDKTILTFAPVGGFAENASYSATIIYANSSQSWSFSTTSAPTLDPQIQQGRAVQAQDDAAWAAHMNDIYQKFPWYDQLPLTSSTYFVSLDTATQILHADLFPQTDSAQEIAQIKQSVQEALQSIGVDLSTIQPEWDVHAPTPTP